MSIRDLLEQHHDRFNRPDFLADDPLGLVHAFTDPRDREIIGFWVATLAWGRRATIIDKGHRLIEAMEGRPYDFVMSHGSDAETIAARLGDWKHRTFTFTDTTYFLRWLQHYYRQHDSLEDAFARHLTPTDRTIEPALRGFHELFFSLPEAPQRTRKHVATPARNSRCKRLCMFLRWMVRYDDRGVDLGQWRRIRPDQLCIPLDVHVERVARHLGLLTRKPCDWRAVLELTENLRKLDGGDPVRYDFALFGMGVSGI
jgi:uncharacterized protein (TIGR02757 family)